MSSDICRQQRFSNYRQALAQLETFFEPPALNDREQQGLIKAFEYTFELAWITLSDLLRSQSDATFLDSHDTNLSSHAYNGSTVDAIAANISGQYLACFQQFKTRLELRLQEEGSVMSVIPGITATRVEQLQQLWAGQPRLGAVWLFGSRAMARLWPGSDINLCLEGPALSLSYLLVLIAGVDDLQLPWRVDQVLLQELTAELGANVQRVGRRIWTAPATTGRR